MTLFGRCPAVPHGPSRLRALAHCSRLPEAYASAMMFPPSLSEQVKVRAFRAHNGELGILPSDTGAFLQACRFDKVRVLGWELWIVDHQCNFADKPIPRMGSWCGLVPVPDDDVPGVFTGDGDVDETERQCGFR